MKTRSKRYKSAVTNKNSTDSYSTAEAVEILNKFETVKFDESVEISISLGVDPKQSSQAVRGTVNLPHGSGKEVKVLVFTETPEDAVAAGADYAGLEDLVKKVKDGWVGFDVALSTSGAMKEVRSVARVLGPRGLMPTPKAGTVTDDIAAAIKEVKAGRVEFKMDKTGAMSVLVGKRSFQPEQLVENTKAALDAVNSARPDGFKGKFIKRVHISSTMSPSVLLSVE
ncbi:MAG: 50S ribosomal protein L1 [Opitutae bacterium]|nr:50S ribosomal protein L1 [Opitutae bacterium]